MTTLARISTLGCLLLSTIARPAVAASLFQPGDIVLVDNTAQELIQIDPATKQATVVSTNPAYLDGKAIGFGTDGSLLMTVN